MQLQRKQSPHYFLLVEPKVQIASYCLFSRILDEQDNRLANRMDFDIDDFNKLQDVRKILLRNTLLINIHFVIASVYAINIV